MRGGLSRARTVDELCGRLSSLLGALYAPGSRSELFVSIDGRLVPMIHRDGAEARASRNALASLDTRLLAVRRPLTEPAALAAHETSGNRAVISAPVLDGSGVLAGLLVVEGAPDQPQFAPVEIVALEGIAAQLSAVALRRDAVRADPARARRRVDRETACQIQRAFMSAGLPPGIGVTAHAEYLPAFEVGGDFYNVSYDEDRGVDVTIGDVSGNGVSAALVMSRVIADVERAVASGSSPAAVLAAANARLSGAVGEMFVTAACARIDPDRRRLTVANAGHLPVVIRREGGEVFTFGGASGTPLGMLPCEYAEDDLLLEKGDIVLLMTDGLLEALDHPTGHRGMELLLAEVHSCGHDAAAIHGRMRTLVEEARLEHPLDDVTWVGLQIA